MSLNLNLLIYFQYIQSQEKYAPDLCHMIQLIASYSISQTNINPHLFYYLKGNIVPIGLFIATLLVVD